jgi:hypothetical protein
MIPHAMWCGILRAAGIVVNWRSLGAGQLRALGLLSTFRSEIDLLNLVGDGEKTRRPSGVLGPQNSERKSPKVITERKIQWQPI